MASTDLVDQQEKNSSIVARNSIILLGKYLSIWATSVLLVLFLPRYLGSQGLGQLQFVQSFVMLMSVAIGLGTMPYLMKEVARDHSKLGAFHGGESGRLRRRHEAGCLAREGCGHGVVPADWAWSRNVCWTRPFLIRAVTQDIAFLRTTIKRRMEDRPVDLEI